MTLKKLNQFSLRSFIRRDDCVATFFVIRDGKIVVQQVGGRDKDELAEMIAP